MKSLIVALVLSSFCFASNAWEDWNDYLVKELKLSQPQAGKLKDVRAKYRPDLERLMDKKSDLKSELRELSKNPSKSKDQDRKMREKFTQLQAANLEYDQKRFEMMMEAREILRPEQLSNIDHVLDRKWKYHKWRKNRVKQAEEASE